jgi:hypothetical protein
MFRIMTAINIIFAIVVIGLGIMKLINILIKVSINMQLEESTSIHRYSYHFI